MASLSSLPNELLIAIIEHLLPSQEGVPITGFNAAWTPLSSVERRHNFYHLDTLASDWFDGPEYNMDWITTNIKDTPFTRYATLWSLRRSNRDFNNLCIPYLFHDLNLLDNSMDASSIQIVSPYASHVKSIRVLLDPPHSEDSDSANRHEELSALIVRCHNATSLALYYNEFSSSVGQIGQSIVDLMRLGKIRSFGIYSNMVLRVVYGSWTWNEKLAGKISRFLETLFDLPETRASLRELDIVMEKTSKELYGQLRPLVTDLQALTIRRAFRISFGRIWEPFNCIQWSPSTQLQRLNLIDCSNAYAPHIPELVGHFKSLQCLIVSTCGDETDLQILPRTHGWSHSPGALCKHHIPLEMFHVEHMYEWEINAMGTIPTRKLISSRVEIRQLIDVFLKDKEVFPGLQYLSIENNWTPIDDKKSQEEELQKICRERSILLDWNATRIKEGGVAVNFDLF
ncbi:hypothetical protein CPB86DRAFT_703109 [Serendipita vermifera]|nr:hypothetical protein CPB86DRAFT_703109 [Serendipita vermifera]